MVDNLCDYYESFYKTAPIGFYTTSLKDGTIYMANPACMKMLGYTNLNKLQQDIKATDLYPKKDRQKFIAEMKKEGCVTDFETQLTIGEKTIWVLLSGCIEGDYIQGAIIDISDKQQMREELEKYKKRSLIEARNIGAAIERRIEDSFHASKKVS